MKKVKDYITNTDCSVNFERGLVVKIQDFKSDGRNYHNYWAVILGMYDNETYRVGVEISNCLTDIIGIKKHNIKTIIGNLKCDFADIGATRHAEEVIPLINKMLKR